MKPRKYITAVTSVRHLSLSCALYSMLVPIPLSEILILNSYVH